MAVTSWSIKREDILLLRALRDVDHNTGFYIDVGANSPDDDSVTKLFYDHGWRGLNVEASPHWYARLAKERPRDINVHVAASDKPGTITLYDHPEGGLATINEQFADRHQENYSIAKRAVTVGAATLTELCEKYAPPTIHFLKIDIEGHEEQALRGMDFSRFRPWIICVEATEPLRVEVLTHEAWDHLITGKDYRYVQFDGLNRWYVAEEHAECFSAFTSPVDDYVHYSYLRTIDHLERRISELEDPVKRANDLAALPAEIARLYDNKPENAYYEALFGGSRSLRGRPAQLHLISTICSQLHFSLDEYRFWMSAFSRLPRMHRKDWEWFYIAQVLFERGCLESGKRGLGFAAGPEPLPAEFAARGCTIVSADHSGRSNIVSDETGSHDGKGLSYRAIDANDLPASLDGDYDFCWSIGLLQHLGSLERGLHFVERAVRTLKPGGVSVHTTEFNLSSNADTLETESLSLFRRRDIEALITRLEAAGHSVVPFDWNLGQGFAEIAVDMPPYRQSPHLRLRFGDYDVTSIGFIVQRG